VARMVELLREIGTPSAARLLRRVAEDPSYDPWVRVRFASALATVGDIDAAVQALMDVGRAPHGIGRFSARHSAANALSVLGELDAAYSILELVLNDPGESPAARMRASEMVIELDRGRRSAVETFEE